MKENYGERVLRRPTPDKRMKAEEELYEPILKRNEDGSPVDKGDE